MEKPDGLTVITPEQGPDTVAALPVRRFHGIGPATASRLHAIGVHTGRDLRCADPALLARVLGRSTAYFQGLARGEDPRRVTPSRPRKSLGSERTFQQDLRTAEQVLEAAEALAEEVAEGLRRAGGQARTVSLKIKYADFRLITRSRTFSRPLTEAAELKAALPMLLAETRAGRQPIRLVGVALSGLEPDARGSSGEQLSLFQAL
jgi:DNA polymerase-4